MMTYGEIADIIGILMEDANTTDCDELLNYLLENKDMKAIHVVSDTI
jgi:hypothetical protein